MGVLESPGFFVSKRVGTLLKIQYCIRGLRPLTETHLVLRFSKARIPVSFLNAPHMQCIVLLENSDGQFELRCS